MWGPAMVEAMESYVIVSEFSTFLECFPKFQGGDKGRAGSGRKEWKTLTEGHSRNAKDVVFNVEVLGSLEPGLAQFKDAICVPGQVYYCQWN